MGRKKIWGEYKTMKVKVVKTKFEQYKGFLLLKRKTIQQDLNDHVENCIK